MLNSQTHAPVRPEFKTKPMRNLILSLALTASFVSALHAQPKTPAPAPAPTNFPMIVKSVELKDGDSFVFLGDSITHQCLYSQYIEDFYYTRYPSNRIHFHNSGVGGDRAADALRRFDEDVAAFKPKYVTVLLGMNDGTYRDFDKATFDTYQKDMNTVLDRIKEIGATAIPMTPTMHDARAARMGKRGPQEPRDTYYNGVLALYGAWLREQSQVRGLGFVDMWSPLNNLTLEARKTNATYTLIKDAVHPDAPGQVVMAVAILNDMVPKSAVSQIIVAAQPKTGKLGATAANGKVSDFQHDGDKISFNFKANALPWVLPPDAAEGYKLTHAGHRNGNEKIIVRNLPAGKYALHIDGEFVGTYLDGQLAFGVELEENSKTPQYQQALKVAMINKDRNDQAVHPLRDLWRDLKIKRNALSKAADKAAAEAALEQWVTGTMKPGIEKLRALAKTFEDQIYQANKIPARKYELNRVN